MISWVASTSFYLIGLSRQLLWSPVIREGICPELSCLLLVARHALTAVDLGGVCVSDVSSLHYSRIVIERYYISI